DQGKKVQIMHKNDWRWALFLVILGEIPCLALAQPDVHYQLRTQEESGSWSEGVKPKPVAGGAVELISVLADYQEPVSSGGLPASAKLRCYLDGSHEVFLIVRELDYRTYYWLDHVQPARPWQKGFQNIFAWPSGPVLQQLTPKPELYDLG